MSTATDTPTVVSPFAIVILRSLSVKRFNNKDDWETSMANLRHQQTDFIPLKYHYGVESYVELEKA